MPEAARSLHANRRLSIADSTRPTRIVIPSEQREPRAPRRPLLPCSAPRDRHARNVRIVRADSTLDASSGQAYAPGSFHQFCPHHRCNVELTFRLNQSPAGAQVTSQSEGVA
jgi:hypothetical protein